MKFSENWLRTFVNPALTSGQLAHELTMAGLEVEALEPVAPAFDKVVVGKVLALEKHPDADRLQICQVEVGAAAPLQIVCGAPNVRVGAKVPCALAGAQLPAMVIKRAKVRGVESLGMLCSAQELGLAPASGGLLLLPADAPVGTDIRAYLDLNDTLFTLKLTPNRSDCLSVAGVAREVAAITAAPLALPQGAAVPVSLSDRLAVGVAAAACPRYCGRVVRGVNAAAPTPDWMVRRLERSGLRSISAVVDVTNYVMLELGQPLHAFDLDRISGALAVRFALPGEEIRLLNEQDVALDPDMLVIADDEKALALAGIMGGAESAVSAATTALFLESAFFSPAAMAGKARRLGLASDSSYRFERGVDFAATRDGLERATQLLLEICGGEAGAVTEVTGELPRRDPIRLRFSRACRVLGVDLGRDAIEALLRRLQLGFAEADGDCLVTPPSHRFDLSLEADLIEELARLYGYDNIPAAMPKSGLTLLPQSEAGRSLEAVSRVLLARDYQEIISYSFVDSAWERELAGNEAPIVLKNPIASQMSVMRSSLAGGLVDALIFNLNRKQERVRLFETGRCFVAQEQGPQAGSAYHQPVRIAGLCYGGAHPEQWGEPWRQVDYYDAKADVEALCWPGRVRFVAAPHPALHPGRSAQVWRDGVCLGWLGVLHPRWQQKYELPLPPVLFELDAAGLQQRDLPAFREISKFQPLRRDFAVIVAEQTSVQALLEAMHENLPGIVTELALFDVYRGKGIDSAKKSLAFRVLMQDTRKTLTDGEAEAVVAQLTAILISRFNAVLRIA